MQSKIESKTDSDKNNGVKFSMSDFVPHEQWTRIGIVKGKPISTRDLASAFLSGDDFLACFGTKVSVAIEGFVASLTSEGWRTAFENWLKKIPPEYLDSGPIQNIRQSISRRTDKPNVC